MTISSSTITATSMHHNRTVENAVVIFHRKNDQLKGSISIDMRLIIDTHTMHNVIFAKLRVISEHF